MKFFKLYSVSISFISLNLLFVYMLFIYNNIPKKIEAFKYISQLNHDIPIYLLFTLFSMIIFYNLKNIKNYLYAIVFLLLFNFLIITEITDHTAMRRLYRMVILLPSLIIFFKYFSFRNVDYYKKVTHIFLYISLICIVFPGIYLPPFFNGIAGWTVQINKNKDITTTNLYLVRDDGKEIVYSRALINPINFEHRLYNNAKKQSPEVLDKFYTFLKTTYDKRWKILKEGKYPNQKYLGNISYPGHNPYGKYSYINFPPNQIIKIKYSTKYYTWDKKFKKEIVKSYKEFK